MLKLLITYELGKNLNYWIGLYIDQNGELKVTYIYNK